MEPAVDVHRLHFAFTITFHYIFPQLTMGLALLIVYPENQSPAHRRRALQPRRPILGKNFRQSISRSAWSPESPWNFSSAPTGPHFPGPPAA